MKSIRLEHRSECGSGEKRRSCIWMQAEVVFRKYCKIDYQCASCRFDRVMMNLADENKKQAQTGKIPIGKKGKIVSWKDKLRDRTVARRPCIHHMKERIEFKTCNHEYHCANCEFDQYFQDQYSVYTVIKPVEVLNIKGFKIPQGYYLHPGHVWIRVEEGDQIRMGMDEFALRLLGPLDSIKAPLIGKEVKQNRTDIEVTRGTNHAKFLSPVSGVVTAVNNRLRDEGSLANKDPYSEGWVMSVHPSNLRPDLKNLMLNTETEDYLGKQVDYLYQIIEETAGPLAADGGDLGNDIYGNLPGLSWEKITRIFLNT